MFATIDIAPAGAPGARGHAFQKKLFDNGLHLKTTGDSRDPRAAADRREVAYRYDRGHLAQDARDDLDRSAARAPESAAGAIAMHREDA